MMNYLEKKKKAMLNYVSGTTPPPLPSEYQQVEWIGATGTQYINTLFPADVDVSISINFAINNDATSDCFICGSRKGANHTQLTIRWRTSNKIWVVTPRNNNLGDNSCNQEIAITTPKETFMQVDVKCDDMSNEIYIDNELKFSNTDIKTAFSNGNTIFLFACNLNGGSELKSKAKIKSCQLFKGNTKERDFIPCYRKSDNEIGMYDTVTQTFYTNAGSGTFTKGGDI